MPSEKTLELRVLEAALRLEAAADWVTQGNGVGRLDVVKGRAVTAVRRARPLLLQQRRAQRAKLAVELQAALGCARKVARREAFASVAARCITKPAVRRRMQAADLARGEPGADSGGGAE